MISILLYGTVLLFLNNVEGKTCDCGNWCNQFKGTIVNERCYFIAPKNMLYGQQFIVSNAQQEQFLTDTILNGLTTRTNLHVSTDLGHQFSGFHQNCLSHICNDTVYVKTCECKLNVFEKFVDMVTIFYERYNELFWITVVILLILIFIVLLKCFCQILA